jgi:hypothetical protein
MGYCFDVAYHERTDRLYVAGGARGIHVFEVKKGEFNFITTVRDGGYHRNLKISGDRAYVADTKRGLVVFDVTEKIPVCTWKQQKPGGMGIYIHNNRAYLAAGAEGLRIFDISKPDHPKEMGKCETNGDAWDVWVSGEYAYVADLQKGITVVDISLPSRPQKVSCVTWDKKNPMAEIVRGEGKFAYVGAGKHGLVAVDISNPLNPKVVSQYKSGPGAFGEGLCVKNGLVYLANGNKDNRDENGLIIIDARNPSSLKVHGKRTFSNWVEGVCLAGDHAFITNTYSGIRSVNIRDPKNPRLVDSYGRSSREGERTLANDTFLETEISRQEQKTIEEFRRVKARILAGEEYEDTSTPLHAALTFFSAKYNTPEDYYMKLDILRAPLPAAQPEEGTLWPVYMRNPKQRKLADTFILGYSQGKWLWLGNAGCPTDWRAFRPMFKQELLERSGKEESQSKH